MFSFIKRQILKCQLTANDGTEAQIFVGGCILAKLIFFITHLTVETSFCWRKLSHFALYCNCITPSARVKCFPNLSSNYAPVIVIQLQSFFCKYAFLMIQHYNTFIISRFFYRLLQLYFWTQTFAPNISTIKSIV